MPIRGSIGARGLRPPRRLADPAALLRLDDHSGHYNLADARLWHLLFAWPFAFGLLLFMLASLANRHFRRDLVTSRREWRWSAIRADIVQHLKLDFTHRGAKFNFLQKLAYGVVIFILLPLMIFTGLTMSPGWMQTGRS